MKIPKTELLQAARKQRNLLIKLALYWLWALLCLLDWLLKAGDKGPKGDLVDLTVRKGKK